MPRLRAREGTFFGGLGADIVGSIAITTREQSQGIDLVNRAVSEMQRVIDATATQTGQVASTAAALGGEAEDLHALVSRFKLGDAPGHHAVPPDPLDHPGPRRAVTGVAQ